MLRNTLAHFAQRGGEWLIVESVMDIPHAVEKKCLSFGGCVAFSCCMALVALCSPVTKAEVTDAPTKTESPYFYLPGGNPAVDALPLKATDVSVRISGVIADVTVTQTYKNEGARPIEAKYVFPGSTRAAVHAMNVRLADRLITAKIREKKKAQQEYDQAKSEGKTAALLEQHRPNVFQMNVANILPGDDVRVELHYTELLTPENGRYQFVFPTVVGPRYNSPQSASAQEKWVAQPTLPKGKDSPAKFDLRVALDTPISIKEVSSPSHAIDSRSEGERHADIRIKPDATRAANNRDFILDYRLAGDAVESGVMLMRGQGQDAENFFLAMVEPPKTTPVSVIVPREYIFVVDISGSMHGFPLNTAKVMMSELLRGLRPGDTFNVLLFAGSCELLGEHSVAATPENIAKTMRLIDQQNGGGSTELIPALRHVYAQPKNGDHSRTIVVVTDGYVSVENEAFNLVRRNLGEANLFAFGIGASVNRHLIEGLARAGMGEPFIITNPDEAAEQASRFRQMISSPVLTNVRANFTGVEAYDVAPQSLPDVLSERPVILFGKWRDAPQSKAKKQFVIEGKGAQGAYRQTFPLLEMLDKNEAYFSALQHLWARQRIAERSDQENLTGDGRLREEITQLGLTYSLLTQYTSFIAVDEQKRHPNPGDVTSVNQPQPLPDGVSNLAVGGAFVPSTPEPESLGALLLTLSMLAMLARRRARQRRHHLTL
ncbi:inter-alpha-trypsin inhibitor domain-containing protein [Betaproteobacteria bacterium]|nr:inter-alpha-trypsin inhibitor domain-containing protein [Betaproteobacteria bacterium]